MSKERETLWPFVAGRFVSNKVSKRVVVNRYIGGSKGTCTSVHRIERGEPKGQLVFSNTKSCLITFFFLGSRREQLEKLKGALLRRIQWICWFFFLVFSLFYFEIVSL